MILTKRKHKNSILKIGVSLLLGVLLIFAGVVGYQIINQSVLGDKYVSATERSSMKEKILISINIQRTRAQLPQLIEQAQLASAAQNKTDDMAANNYFSHTRISDGYKWSDFVDASGYNYQYAGENLAKGYTSVDVMVSAWMDSPTHRENILSTDYSDTGIGISYLKTETGSVMYVAQMFGKSY